MMLDKSNPCRSLARFIPVFDWGRTYNRDALGNDMVAAVIVTIMLIPQSLAYALLAGLPAETGIYASIAPIVLYAIFGTSRALAVGPVAVVSLMTAAAIGNLAEPGSPELLVAAITLAFISGLFLILLGVFRLGFLANFLSHPVIAGFITASGILIALSQLRHVLGIPGGGANLPEQIGSLIENIGQINPDHACDRGQRHGFPVLGAQGADAALAGDRDEPKLAGVLAKAGPVAAVVVTTFAAWGLDLNASYGVRVVGEVPQGLPPLTMPSFSADLWAP
jgi:SulP family sulfate permease